ncbi:MAG TPA: hypothetical protein VG602_06600 [Actinomycetota bacterium]|nr:hypothetical protein [Actinomycetota bacterium]
MAELNPGSGAAQRLELTRCHNPVVDQPDVFPSNWSENRSPAAGAEGARNNTEESVRRAVIRDLTARRDGGEVRAPGIITPESGLVANVRFATSRVHDYM